MQNKILFRVFVDGALLFWVVFFVKSMEVKLSAIAVVEEEENSLIVLTDEQQLDIELHFLLDWAELWFVHAW